MNETYQCFVLPNPEFEAANERLVSNLATASINALTAPFAVAANLLTIYVIVTKAALHSPSNVLIASLAFSDFLVGLIVQPCYIAFRIIETKDHYVPCPLRIVYSESFWICYGVSFVTLSAISVERFVALRLHLRYNELVTVRRVLTAALAIWLIDISCTSLEWITWNKLIRKTQAVLWACCLLVTCVAHSGIFRILRHHQRQIRALHNQARERQHSYKRQARLAKNAAYFVGIYIVCNLPVLIVTAYAFFAGTGIKDVSLFSWAETVAFLNSSISPVVCWWRNYAIRQGVRNALDRVCFNGGNGAAIRRPSGSFPRGASDCANERELRTVSVIRRYIVADEGNVSQNYQTARKPLDNSDLFQIYQSRSISIA